MIQLQSLTDLKTLHETVTLECKLAFGRDGEGAIPVDFWETYSAFANTYGGMIILGVQEKKGVFTLHGVPNPTRMKTDLFNTLNNPQKVSYNLVNDSHVNIVEIDGFQLITVEVLQASRNQKPIYLNGNPFNGSTYRRLHDGDRKCSEDVVRRMIAEQVMDSRDIQILKGFTLEDLEPETLRSYRQILNNYNPDHPWNVPDTMEFLRRTNCWRKDRQTGEEGLTLAAVLMFGTWTAIAEAAPLLFWDYQELPEFPN
jgi:ATP-dependent DNA helicase RecG